MPKLEVIPLDIPARLDEIINLSWRIFTNRFINNKYDINLEAPFQLHFASILKNVGDLYCVKKRELFDVNLEVNMPYKINKRNNVDIVLSLINIENDLEYIIPIELKYKTQDQSAEILGVMQIYRDLYSLECLYKKTYPNNCIIPFSYFFIITDDSRYIKKAKSGVKTVFRTDDSYSIIPGNDYKYLESKTAKKFHEDYGSFNYLNSYKFNWSEHAFSNGQKKWFCRIKIMDVS